MDAAVRLFPIVRRVGAILALLLVVRGCALGRGTVSIPVESGDGPAAGPAVAFAQVVDARRFERSPSEPSTPSLMDADEITNPAVTSRAIARKRGGFGAAMGDIVLPEGETVAQLVESAIARGFRRAGYRVVGNAVTSEPAPIPVTVEIDQFWAWFTPGFATIAVECKSDVTVTAPSTPFAAGQPIAVRVRETGFAATESMWIDIVKKALDALSDKVYQNLTAPSAMS